MTSPPWYKGALCSNLHSEMFYPPLFKEDRKAPESNYYKLGKLVCENCHLQSQCLEKGEQEEFGLWGGYTPKERRTGKFVPTKTYLPKGKIGLLPKRSQEPLDVEAALLEIRPHMKRRPRKKAK